MQALTDFSQFGQPRVFQRFLSKNTPRSVVDIGAHDGVMGSNSRELVLRGWQAILVEPLPAAFSRLQENCRGLENAKCVNAACSNRSGKARLFIGSDGTSGQTSTMCMDDALAESRKKGSIEVEALTATELLDRHRWPSRIGILLIDTEGLDLEVLESLDITRFRPDLIVTEEYDDGNGKGRRKYELLFRYGYRFCGLAGSDSIWQAEEIGREDPQHQAAREFAGASLPPEIAALPQGIPGSCRFDWPPIEKSDCVMPVHGSATFIGWACESSRRAIPPHVFLRLKNQQTGAVEYLQGVRAPRLDVVQYFSDESLLFSGFRVHVPLIEREAGRYSVQLIQANDRYKFESAENAFFTVPLVKPGGELERQFLTGRGLLVGPQEPRFCDLPGVSSAQSISAVPTTPGREVSDYERIADASHDFVAFTLLSPDAAGSVASLLRIVSPKGVLYLRGNLCPLSGGWSPGQWVRFVAELTREGNPRATVLAMTVGGLEAQAVLSRADSLA